MMPRFSALLVHGQDERMRTLRAALEKQGVSTVHSRSCREAADLLRGSQPPVLVFTDTVLPDGTWADVAMVAAAAPEPVNVIVVSPWVDVKAYLDAIEGGAFDYLVPPFEGPGLNHVIECAASDALRRREAGGAAA